MRAGNNSDANGAGWLIASIEASEEKMASIANAARIELRNGQLTRSMKRFTQAHSTATDD